MALYDQEITQRQGTKSYKKLLYIVDNYLGEALLRKNQSSLASNNKNANAGIHAGVVNGKPGYCKKWARNGECTFGDKCHWAASHTAENKNKDADGDAAPAPPKLLAMLCADMASSCVPSVSPVVTVVELPCDDDALDMDARQVWSRDRPLPAELDKSSSASSPRTEYPSRCACMATARWLVMYVTTSRPGRVRLIQGGGGGASRSANLIL